MKHLRNILTCLLLGYIISRQCLAQEKLKSSSTTSMSGSWIRIDPQGNSDSGNFLSMDKEGLRWSSVEKDQTNQIDWSKVEELRRNVQVGRDTMTDSTLGPFILLPDGDRLRGESVAILENRGLAVQSLSIGIINIPMDQWAGSLTDPPENPDDFLRLYHELRTGSGKPGDLVILSNNDRLLGTVIGLDGDDLSIQPLGATKPAIIKRTEVRGISIDPKSIKYQPHSGTIWQIYLSDGSRISAVDLQSENVEGESVLRMTTRWNSVWNIPTSKLSRILMIPAEQSFLGNRQPDATQTVDYVGMTPKPTFGSNINGGPLQIGLQSFDHGIGTQARTLIAYRLEGNEISFSGWVGLDKTASPLGSAKAVILVDGKPVFDSGEIKAGSAPQRIQIELKNARLLILSSEFGEGGGVCDWINWCELRITRDKTP